MSRDVRDVTEPGPARNICNVRGYTDCAQEGVVPPSLYRSFTSVEELDAQYDIEASVPDFTVYADDWVVRSAAARERLAGRLDVPYGPTLAETLDVFSPGPGVYPTVFFVHGGYWTITDSKVWSFVAEGLVAAGFTVVVENYALAPAVSVAEIVREHRAALAHVWRHADELGVDRSALVVAGHSAGGHAVAELLGTDWSGDYGLPPTMIAAALAISSVVDLRPLPRTWLAPKLGLSSGDAVALSPCLRLPAVMPRTLVVVGTQETAEFERQSREYAAAAVEAGHPVEFRALDRNHFDILEELAHPDGSLLSWIREAV
jgi:arylformamidase